MRAKRKSITIAVLLIVAAVIALLSRDNQPRYQGKKLSQWIDSYHARVNAYTQPRLEEVNRPEIQAVRAIGTNALPFLLDWIRYEASSSKPKQFLYRTLEGFRLRVWRDPAEVRAERAAAGFAMLGPVASPAIPHLAKIAGAPSGSDAPARAIYALVGIGPTALPALAEVIKNTNAVARYEAVIAINYAIRKFGTNAFPILVDCLDDPDARIALGAADALREVRAEPAIVCAKMTRLLHHPDWRKRHEAIGIVATYREQARSIVPELVEALSDTNSMVRESAERVLRRIAPEALTNAPAN